MPCGRRQSRSGVLLHAPFAPSPGVLPPPEVTGGTMAYTTRLYIIYFIHHHLLVLRPGVLPPPEGYNPATWMLEVTGAAKAVRVAAVNADWPQVRGIGV